MREVDISIDECKKIMLEIACYIHEICIKHDIKYSLAYGSLIGAIRHDGFIPWDDDFDIFLTKENYDKLMEILKQSKEHYVLDINSDGYHLNFAKLCHKNTKGIQTNKASPVLRDFGVFVDIFPLYNIYGDGKSHLKQIGKILKKLTLMSYVNYNKSGKNFRNSYKSITNFPRFIYYKFIIGRKRVLKELHEWQNKFNSWQTDQVGIYSTGTKEIYKKAHFSEYILHKFEDKEFMIIKDYDPVLRQYYGDYMKLPPLSEQTGHHPYKYSIKEHSLNSPKS